MCAVFIRQFSRDVMPIGLQRQWFRALRLWVMGATCVLTGCQAIDLTEKPKNTPYEGTFLGTVVADEHTAAHVGKTILQADGSAADAAVAAGLALAVTLPSSVGLGGGGVCLVHNQVSNTVEALDFLPPEGPSGMAVPSLVRGLFALHARYGTRRWEELVQPAEALARFGVNPSPMLISHLKKYRHAILRDPNTQKVFQGLLETGHDRLFQPDLALFLAHLRSRPIALYTGSMGHDFITAARPTLNGLSPTADQFRNYRPVWKDPLSLEVGHNTLYSISPGGSRNTVLTEWERKSENMSRRPWSSQDLPVGAAGLTVTDAKGTTVSCVLSMNAPFGTGHMVPGFGVLTAPTSPPTRTKVFPFSLTFAANTYTHVLNTAITSTGRGAEANTVDALRSLLEEGGRMTLSEVFKGLEHQTSGPALTSGVHCPGGFAKHPALCQPVPDPRGYGRGLLVGTQTPPSL